MIITANGNRFDTLLEGPADAPAIALGHSLSCDLGAWDELAADLSKDYRVLRYSLRGHGKSVVTPPPYTMALLADDLAAILDHYGIRESHILGLSIGGMIAQEFALRYPDRVLSFVISSSMCVLPEGAAELWPERIRIAKEEGLVSTVEATLARWFVPGSLERRPEVAERVRRMIAGTSVDGYVGCCHAIAGLDLKDRIGAIKAKTLVLVGRDDPGTPPSAAEEIHRRIMGSRLVVIDNASHQLALEQPELFRDEVRRHLAGV